MASKITNKRAILLTATIVPNSVYTHHLDPLVRLQEYMRAVEFYCAQFPGEDVFLLENSSFDLEAQPLFQQTLNKCTFRVLRFPASDRFYEGKGYQEFEMLDKAVEQLSKDYALFVKVTGRYIVKNAFALTSHHCPGLTIDIYQRGTKADTFFMYFTGDFYQQHLKGIYAQVNDNESRFIEKVLYDKIMKDGLLRFCRLFPATTIMEGQSGSYNISLKRHPFKVFLRNLERSLYNILGVKTFFY